MPIPGQQGNVREGAADIGGDAIEGRCVVDGQGQEVPGGLVGWAGEPMVQVRPQGYFSARHRATVRRRLGRLLAAKSRVERRGPAGLTLFVEIRMPSSSRTPWPRPRAGSATR